MVVVEEIGGCEFLQVSMNWGNERERVAEMC